MPILQGFSGFLHAFWLYFGSIPKIRLELEWRIEPKVQLMKCCKQLISFYGNVGCVLADDAVAVDEMTFYFFNVSSNRI